MKFDAEVYGHELLERLFRNTRTAALRMVTRPRDEIDYNRGMGHLGSPIVKVHRNEREQLSILIGATRAGLFGLLNCEYLIMDNLADGTPCLRPATQNDLANNHQRFAATPLPAFVQAERCLQMVHIEKVCERCGQDYCARGPRQKICDSCKARRQQSYERKRWHIRGKQTAAYQRKLRRRTPIMREPVVAGGIARQSAEALEA